jgi:hypothetical protein
VDTSLWPTSRTFTSAYCISSVYILFSATDFNIQDHRILSTYQIHRSAKSRPDYHETYSIAHRLLDTLNKHQQHPSPLSLRSIPLTSTRRSDRWAFNDIAKPADTGPANQRAGQYCLSRAHRNCPGPFRLLGHLSPAQDYLQCHLGYSQDRRCA